MIETPLVAALIMVAIAAISLAFRSFQLLYRDFRPKYRGRHRGRRRRPPLESAYDIDEDDPGYIAFDGG